jgi:hypothetical protein
MTDLLFGGDPEFFICKKGNVIPPIFFKKQGIASPIKEHPKHPVYFERKDVKIIQDGVAFETNMTPSKTPKEFFRKISTAIDILEDFADKTGNKLIIKSTVGFNPTEFYEIQDEEIRQCVIFGCDPDRDAFDQKFKAYEFDVSKFPYRFGGGHFHISGPESFRKWPIPAIKLLAFTCGNFYIANSKMVELDKIRAKYYGKAGKFREQVYSDRSFGLEYRSLPNYWVKDLDMIEGMFHWARKAIEYLENPQVGSELIKNLSDITCKSMKNVTPKISREILKSLPA